MSETKDKNKSTMENRITEVKNVVSKFTPPIIIDSHMHIQSSRTVPLPFLWAKSYVLKNETRETIEGWISGKISNRKRMVDASTMPTDKVGDGFMIERNRVYNEYLKNEGLYKDVENLVLISMVMTMDMEYMHLSGYFGLKVYVMSSFDDYGMKHPNYSSVLFYKNWDKEKISIEEKSGIKGIYYDNKGYQREVRVNTELEEIDPNETDIFEPWDKQISRTELAVLKYPLKLLPMYHYDPRRWQVSDGSVDGNKEPFAKVGESGLFIGFKMYTPLGYRPLDVHRLPILMRFYETCCTKNIPILNHCTPEGAQTYEREKYLTFSHPMDTPDEKNPQSEFTHWHGNKPVDYFNQEFVSPKAWKKVLDTTNVEKKVKLNELRLCLAHFGGGTELGRQWFDEIITVLMNDKYPNVFVDISSSMMSKEFCDYFEKTINEKKNDDNFKKIIRKRILFGTDWYLTLDQNVSYMDYFKKTKEFLDKFPAELELWKYFTLVNPCNFYRLDQCIERIANNIIRLRKEDNKIISNFGPLKKSDEDDIIKEAAYIKRAITPIRNLLDQNEINLC